MTSVAFVVLAAGSGTRFGGSKLDADLAGRELGKWATDLVEKVTDTSRFIVVKPDPPAFTARLEGWRLIINPEFGRGIGSSIRTAISVIRNYDRVVFTLADMPFMEASVLAKLRDETGVVFTEQADGKPGPPAAFSKEYFDRLSVLPCDQGAAFISKDINYSLLSLTSNADLSDVDTCHDLIKVRIRASNLQFR